MPEQLIATQTIPAGTLVTAQSYLIDRILPDCEIIALPQKEMQSGALTWTFGPVEACPPKRSEKKRLRALIGNGAVRTVEAVSDDHWLIDLRPNSPANWAHFLNNHLPSLFALAEAAELDPGRALAILPSDVPGYIQKAAALFEIEVMLSDATVTGQGITYALDPWSALRTARAGWVQLAAPQARVQAILAEAPEKPLPKKVFLTRKDTRTLLNSAEIETFLAARGFETVLPETLSPADQFRLFLGAEEIVAIHGAGLAPLLYCTPERGPKKFIELLPCGHMTDVYRVMAAQVGCAWIGVRGRIKPDYINHVYKTAGGPYVTHSLDAFEVDPVSLERAFDMIERQARPVLS